MMSRVTNFIPRADMRACVSHTECKGTVTDNLEKMKKNGMRKVQIKRNPWQQAKHAGYILIYSRVYRENL